MRRKRLEEIIRELERYEKIYPPIEEEEEEYEEKEEEGYRIFTVDDIAVMGKAVIYTSFPFEAKVREEDMKVLRRLVRLPRKIRQKYKFIIKDGYLEFIK